MPPPYPLRTESKSLGSTTRKMEAYLRPNQLATMVKTIRRKMTTPKTLIPKMTLKKKVRVKVRVRVKMATTNLPTLTQTRSQRTKTMKKRRRMKTKKRTHLNHWRLKGRTLSRMPMMLTTSMTM